MDIGNALRNITLEAGSRPWLEEEEEEGAGEGNSCLLNVCFLPRESSVPEASHMEEEIRGGFGIGTYNHLPQHHSFLQGWWDKADDKSRSFSSYVFVCSLQQGAGILRFGEDACATTTCLLRFISCL